MSTSRIEQPLARPVLLAVLAVATALGACAIGRTEQPEFGPNESILDCSAGVSRETSLPENYTEVLGAVGLNTGLLSLAEGPQSEARFAKSGLYVRAGEWFRLSVAPPHDDSAALLWGAEHGQASTFAGEPCGSGSEWIVFTGGYIVEEPSCLTINIEGARGEEEVSVGIGVGC